MRRLIDGRVLMLGMLWLAVGCGSAGTDAQGEDGLTMAFIGFTGENITQSDQVGDTAAQVDVCQDLCSSGSTGGEITVEPFTSTFVNAIFVNRGKADIVLDSYSLNVEDSGVPPKERGISARLIGGRCLGVDSERQCAINSDCGPGGVCTHSETLVGLLLFDFDFKQRVRRGDCPFDLESLTLDAKLTITGSDETGNRYTTAANYIATYDNFDNCDNQ